MRRLAGPREARQLVLLAGLVAWAGGCTSLGPARVPADRFNYNRAGARSAHEQLLLNIVRLRYRQPIYFVEVTSMLSQYTFQASANYGSWWNDLNVWPSPLLRGVAGVDGDPSEQTEVGANLGYTDRPTISYAPLQGKDFAVRVLAPIPPPTIIYLSQSGWDIDQLLECCVQRLNDVKNTPIHDIREGNYWSTVKFERVARLLKQVQDAGELNLTVEVDPAVTTSYLSIPKPSPALVPVASELRTLLDLPLALERIRLLPAGSRDQPDELIMQTRSMMGVMNALAQSIEPPARHVASGRVPPSRSARPDGEVKRWLHVEHARLPVDDAFVQVYYNGYWWFIRGSDWRSKGTFSLLTYLFQLQATEAGFEGPLVTVPAGD